MELIVIVDDQGGRVGTQLYQVPEGRFARGDAQEELEELWEALHDHVAFINAIEARGFKPVFEYHGTVVIDAVK